ncbi:MAG: 4'-phosphopantetheinyl transferase superfamily protein [Chloroflexi bacterium]|uniref:4'-phosphopantetheinyl transferase superfamily protein n=1 Tax=Candidatus Chlorohelix allophototropha TaxID=3003348 RepID=A0A8T7M6I2_9CHLR|nr:4'-phosphopantetheinyl transferase superfamily protein [Chloroflexota bacterium]WJW69578.1 4'-phosphopantetheinyl transferase superfamily protein [Chloroflexota bacterium L227-S17]
MSNQSETDWQPASVVSSLQENEVQVWKIELTQARLLLPLFNEYLTSEEIERAKRYRRIQDGERFIIARGLLRHLLGQYLNENPTKIKLSTLAHGKPALSQTTYQKPVEFNISHSGELALLAFSTEMRLGIDLEQINIAIEYSSIARNFFSVSEIRLLEELPLSEKPKYFFRLWTIKEAYLKACGKGLTFPLDQVEIVPAPSQNMVYFTIKTPTPNLQYWKVCELKPDEGYCGALAVDGNDWALRCFKWKEP